MDECVNQPAFGRGRTVAAYLLFFLSGAAALVYEVSWARQIGILFGHTAHAAAVVLTSYFTGLALGYVVGGRLARRVRPLRAYAVAELVAAAWACLVPLLLSATGSAEWSGLIHHPSAPVQLALRWAISFVLLLPATAALGATLPFVAEWLSPAHNSAPARVASAYAANTAGALIGVVAATGWLLVNVGVRGSGFLAAGLSVACGATALALGRFEPRRARGADAFAPPTGQPRSVVREIVPAAVSGFGILALEVLYTRLFSLVFHNSTYTFGAVLAAVLLALALGPILARGAVRRIAPSRLILVAAGTGGVMVPLSLIVFVRITGLEYVRADDGFAAYLAGAFGLVAAVVVPPLTVLGAVLPTVWLAQPGDPGAGQVVGRTAVVNALAGATGAACASLFLLPVLGLWASFAVVAALFATPPVAILAWTRPMAAVVCGLAFLLAAVPIVSPPGPERWAVPTDEILVRRWESAYGWVDVVTRADGVLKVRQNMHYRFGTTGADAPRARRQAHLPLLLHPRPADALFIGLGTGVTASGALPHPEVERVTVVELVPEVVDAARLLSDANAGVIDHPKVEVRVDDARHYLMATDHSFDVIVSDLFIPWESETGYLYTVEHYRTARGRLKPGGLFCQWLPVYQLGARELETIANSFATVFPDVSLWWGHLDAGRPIVALIGSDVPLAPDASAVESRLDALWRAVPPDGEIRTVHDAFALYLGHWKLQPGGSLNTDEYPRVEFLAPVSHRDQNLLHGAVLRRYYGAVLSQLPDRGERFPVPGGSAARRAGHRLALRIE